MAAALVACGSSSGSDGANATPTVTAGSTSTSQSSGSATTAATTPAGLGESFGPERDGRTPLAGFGEVAATITAPDGSTCDVCLLLAADEAQRARGLMEVTDADLGGYDGMLFEFPEAKEGGFWMRNTPSPLSIAYADGEGVVFDVQDMSPCSDDPSCPSYPAERAFTLVLEAPQGAFADLLVEEGSIINVTGITCPARVKS